MVGPHPGQRLYQGGDARLDGGVFTALAEHGHALHLGRLDSFNKAGAARDDMLAGSGAVGGSLGVGGVDALLAALQGEQNLGPAGGGRVGSEGLRSS